MSVIGTLSTPYTVGSAAARHMADINVGFGRPSASWNSRDHYRNEYNEKERLGAGLGTAAGTALPALALATWASKGMRVPGVEASGSLLVARGAGAASLAAMTGVGAVRMYQISQDEGHLGTVGTAAGLALGGATGYRMGGRHAPLVGAGLAVAGGVAGHYAGRMVDIGPGHMGEAAPDTVRRHDSPPGAVQDYARGAFVHFTEAGPSTPGVGFHRWGSRESFREDYSSAERGGAMVGEVAAATILAGGALSMSQRLLVKNPAALDGARVGMLSHVAERANIASHYSHALQGTQNLPGASGGMALLAGGLGAAVAKREYDDWSGDGANPAAGAAAVAATVGTAAGAGYLAHRSAFVQGLNPAVRPAASALTGVILVSALSAARTPTENFISNSRAAWKDNPADRGVTVATAGVGASVGAMGGLRAAQSFLPAGDARTRVAGAIAGAAIGAGAGIGLAPTMPGVRDMATAGGVGAAALGTVGFALTRNPASAVKAAAAGGVMGIAVSPVLGRDDSTDAPAPAARPDATARPVAPRDAADAADAAPATEPELADAAAR